MKQIGFLMDRDGTVTEEVGYVNHVDRLRLLPATAAAIRLINQKGAQAVLVTNQAGVARGYFPEDLVIKVHARLQELLGRDGAYLDAIYYCPHHPQEGPPEYRINCDCRKPKLGMPLKAARDLGLDLSRSFVIGDKISDVVMAHRLGATGILVMTGYGRGEYELHRNEWPVQPHYIAENLLEAVQWAFKVLDSPKIECKSK